MNTTKRAVAGFLAVLGGIVPWAAGAGDRDCYVGVDAVSLRTTLDDMWSQETYATQHGRVRFGCDLIRVLSLEARASSPAHDESSVAGLFIPEVRRFSIDSMYGIYVRPHTPFRNYNVYGIFGMTRMATRYGAVSPPGPEDRNALHYWTLGVGGDFRIVGNLFLDVEAHFGFGLTDYGSYSGGYTVYPSALSAGVRYQF